MPPPKDEMLSIQMTRTDVPNLRPGEEAWRLDTGELVGIRVLRAGRSEKSIALRLESRLLNDDGSTVEVDGEACECRPTHHTVILDALTNGDTNMDAEWNFLRRRGAWRARNHRTALEALARVPPIPDGG